MKTQILFMGIALAFGCSNDKASQSDKPAVENSTSPIVNSPLAPPSAQTSPGTTSQVTVKTSYALYNLPAADANQARSSGILVSVSVKPIKVTSAVAILPSLLSVKCGDEVVAESKVEMTTSKATDLLYQPSVTIPADKTCNGDMIVRFDVLGFDVELGNVMVADIKQTSTAAVIP
ncbi:MAG: hypothetical protein M3Q07_06385 [Pseudobdellovibrionaceae bacterium]|nr:hypothetical protein [Pseudobdellovibrionaceae bacterium]